jgi:hypothetical protein
MNISNFLSDKSEADIVNLRSFLYKNYIKTVIEKNEPTSKDYRLMFIGNRFKSNFYNPISFECNGAIVNYNRVDNTWKTLVIPLELFNSQKLVKDEINKHIVNNHYKLYKVYDGTIVNLYYYNNSWRISTNKAFDATNLLFTKDKTYLDILEELFSLYKDFDKSRLDINKCYTICFKYDKYHTFVENSFEIQNKLILIQSVDMLKFNTDGCININTEEDIGIPVSNQYTLNGELNIKNINFILNNELNRFKRTMSTGTYEPNFGLILRSNNFNITGNYSNILLESNLMSKIRNLIYNHSFAKKLNFYDKLNIPVTEDNIVDKNYYNMQDLINMKVFLIGQEMNLFLTLFPQYKTNIEFYNEFLKFLTKYIIKNYAILQKNIINLPKIMKNVVTLDLILIPTELKLNLNKLNKLAILIVTDLKKKKINLNINENYDTLYDYLHNIVYIDYYYSCIHK